MNKLTRLWRAIENTPGLSDLRAAWESRCDSEFATLLPHLRCTDVVGYRYPCPNPRDADCPRAIVEGKENGSFFAVCRHPHRLCDDLVLTGSDALIHELDLASLMKPVTKALGVRWQPPVYRFPGVWAIGVSARVSTRNQPVFLQIQARRAAFLDGVRRLLVEIAGPFLLMAPTERFRDVTAQELLQARGIAFISLEDDVLIDEYGNFIAIDPVSTDDEHAVTPPADRDRVLNAFCQKYDIPKTKVAEEAEVDPADL